MTTYFWNIELNYSESLGLECFAYHLFSEKIQFCESVKTKEDRLILYLQDRDKDFIEGIIHELTEATIDSLLDFKSFSVTIDNHSLQVKHLLAFLSYPYETIIKLHSTLKFPF